MVGTCSEGKAHFGARSARRKKSIMNKYIGFYSKQQLLHVASPGPPAGRHHMGTLTQASPEAKGQPEMCFIYL